MGVEVQGPGGVTIVFPDGTDPETINRVMTEAVSGRRPSDVAAAREGLSLPLDFVSVEDAAQKLFDQDVSRALEAPGLGKATAFALGAGQGGMAEFADEAVETAGGALGKAPVDANAAYGAAWKRHPVSYGTGYVAGAAAGAPGRLYRAGAAVGQQAAIQAAPLLARTAAGVGGGALSAGVQGAGFSTDDNLGGRLADAATSAAIGGTIGGALPLGGAAAGAVLAPAYRAARSNIPGLQRLPALPGEENRALLELSRRLDEDGVDEAALQAGARAMNQNLDLTTASGQGAVDARQVGAAARDGLEPARALDVMQAQSAENALALIRNAAARRGPGRQMAEQARRATDLTDEASRLQDMAETQVGRLPGGGAPRMTAADVANEVRQAQRGVASPMFEAASEAPIRSTAEIADAIGRPSAQRAIGQMLDRAQERGAGAVDDLARWIEQGDDGVLRVADGAPLRVYQEITQRIDQIAYSDSAAARIGQGAATARDVRDVRATRRAIAEGLRAQSPEYAAALNSFAADEVAKAAARHAETIFSPKSHTTWMRTAAQGSYEGERMAPAWLDDAGQPLPFAIEAARAAAIEQLRAQVRKNPVATISRLSKDQDLQERFRFVFGDDFDRVMGGFRDILTRKRANDYIASRTGSQTAPRTMDAEGVSEGLADATLSLAGGQNALSLALNAVRALRRIGADLTPQEAETIIRLSLSPYTQGSVRNALAGARRAAEDYAARSAVPSLPQTARPIAFQTTGMNFLNPQPALEPR